jgi:phage terminase small subunit
MTERQVRFAEEYPKDFNATRAAKDAGYSEKGAYNQGYELLKNPEVQKKIAERCHEISIENKLNADYIIKHMMAICDAKVTDYVNVRRRTISFKDFDKLSEDQLKCIKSLQAGKNGIRITLHDSNKARDDLARFIRMYDPDFSEGGSETTKNQINIQTLLVNCPRDKIKEFIKNPVVHDAVVEESDDDE